MSTEQPTVQVTGLQVVAIYVSELERARAFYCGHLGFRQTGEMPPGIMLDAGGTTVYLEAGREIA